MSFIAFRDHASGDAVAGGRRSWPASVRRWLPRMRPQQARPAGVVPAAADEVSALTAAQFAAHAGSYQAISAAAAAVHSLLVSTLQANAASYAAAEAANAIAAG